MASAACWGAQRFFASRDRLLVPRQFRRKSSLFGVDALVLHLVALDFRLPGLRRLLERCPFPLDRHPRLADERLLSGDSFLVHCEVLARRLGCRDRPLTPHQFQVRLRPRFLRGGTLLAKQFLRLRQRGLFRRSLPGRRHGRSSRLGLRFGRSGAVFFEN